MKLIKRTPNGANTPEYQPPSKFKALEIKLGDIAGKWRETRDETLIKAYHDAYHKLRSMGWNSSIDPESELPYELMPQDYVDAIYPTQSRG